MLQEYIEGYDVVVHFAGDMAGSAPASSSVDGLRDGARSSRGGWSRPRRSGYRRNRLRAAIKQAQLTLARPAQPGGANWRLELGGLLFFYFLRAITPRDGYLAESGAGELERDRAFQMLS
jgi:hypothetical protein